ncbi:hypothetical protein HZH66_001404 [Vespula vulgaris]|uniref:Uncharacterized protein n=1 Tax=Vespula vulgaris TaxID=7454 RepID=A0A834KTD1_VESVU|nr:hypothetical protein HZH66_001404 [Vespula vulgaris]
MKKKKKKEKEEEEEEEEEDENQRVYTRRECRCAYRVVAEDDLEPLPRLFETSLFPTLVGKPPKKRRTTKE